MHINSPQSTLLGAVIILNGIVHNAPLLATMEKHHVCELIVGDVAGAALFACKIHAVTRFFAHDVTLYYPLIAVVHTMNFINSGVSQMH